MREETGRQNHEKVRMCREGCEEMEAEERNRRKRRRELRKIKV